MGRTTNMSVCMSNSFPSDIGTLIGLILACFGKKKKKGRERKEGKRNFSSLPHYPDKSEKQV